MRRSISETEDGPIGVTGCATAAVAVATRRAVASVAGGHDRSRDKPPSNVTGLRDALRSAATAVGAAFVDPLTDKWFVNDTAKLVGSDGVHPPDEGHKHLADQLQPRIAAALG